MCGGLINPKYLHKPSLIIQISLSHPAIAIGDSIAIREMHH